MPGNLDLKELEDLVRQDEIDTVLTVFPDVQGRLMGKRVVGRHFLGHVAGEGVHACAYLLTVDVDMEPLPGYKFASWATGYQDMKAVPDLGTLRRIPWLEKTALVFCDLYTEEGEPVEVSPRRILQRQVERAAKLGYRLMVASELELYLFKESFAEARAKRYHGLTPVSQYLEDYHILQTTKEEGLVRAIRNGMEAAAVPVEFSKGEWGCGQEEINLRYAEPVEMADRHTLYKHGVKEIAHAQGSSVTFMAKYDMGAAGSSFHLHSSLWDRTGKKSLFYEKGKRLRVGPLRTLARRTDGDGEGVRVLLRALRQLLQALPGRVVRADPDRGGVGQPHVRLPDLRRGLGLPGGEPDPGRRRQSLPRLRRHDRGRAPRHPEEAPGAPGLRGQRLRGSRSSRRSRRRCARPSPSWSAPGWRARRSETTWSSTTSTPRGSSSRRYDQVVTDWELMRGFERI